MKKIGKITIWGLGLLVLFCAILILVCNRIMVSDEKSKAIPELDSLPPPAKEGVWLAQNSVLGHDEKDTIVGNFTGMGIDTLFVVEKDSSTNSLDGNIFYLKSSNKSLPLLNLGLHSGAPELVNEGDLDGNGTIEVGYLPIWTTSQWRTYYVLTFKNGKWCNFIDPNHEYMNTGELIRASGKEIVEPSKKKGWIKVNYETQGADAMIKDTIVKPDFSLIEE